MILQKEPFQESKPKSFFTNPLNVFLMFTFLGLVLISTGFINEFNTDGNATITKLADLMYYTAMTILIFLLGVTLVYYLAKFIYSMKTRREKREAEEGI